MRTFREYSDNIGALQYAMSHIYQVRRRNSDSADCTYFNGMRLCVFSRFLERRKRSENRVPFDVTFLNPKSFVRVCTQVAIIPR